VAAAPASACACAGAGPAASAEEPDRVGDYLHLRALLTALLVLPLVGLEPALDVDLATLREVLAALLRLLPPDLDVVPLGLLLALPGLLVGPGAGGGDAEVGDCLAAGRVTNLGILSEVPDEDDLVHHGASPVACA
jgi:hypothetical protein